MVIWIIGLSGSGKTFFATKLSKKIKKKNIVIDGDEIRKYITNDLGYNITDRRKNSILISKLCKFLENKGYIVICAILSIFKNHQKNNRKNFKKYFQIYIKNKPSDLVNKSKNKVYLKKKFVVGKDIKFNTPYKNDLIIINKFNDKYKDQIEKIYKKIKNEI